MSADTYFCFCCLSTNSLCSLFGSKTEINYAGLLKDLYGIETNCEDYEDESYVCPECADKLTDTMKFKEQVLETLHILQGNGLVNIIQSSLGHLIIQKGLDDDVHSEEDDRRFINLKADIRKDQPKLTEQATTIPPNQPACKLANTQEYQEICLKNEKKITVTHKKGRTQPPLRPQEPTYQVASDLVCRLCGEEQPNTRVFHLHMNQHFPNHICDTCGKGYLTEKRLKRHMTTHDTTSYKCESCGDIFTNYNTYNSHKQRKHSSVPLYKCPWCAQRFATITRRARHLAHAHGQHVDKYVCRVCGMKFAISGNLSSHMRNTHNKVKRHKCAECGAGFFYKQELKAHRAAHDGVKGYQCNVCTKSYLRKNALVVHMRTHTEDKPYRCAKCPRTFTQKSILNKHSKLHNSLPTETKSSGDTKENAPYIKQGIGENCGANVAVSLAR